MEENEPVNPEKSDIKKQEEKFFDKS